jgi:hypothetical protein
MVIYPIRNFLKILLLFVSSLSVPKCASSNQETISLEPTTETQYPTNSFLKYYNSIEEDFTIRMPAYSLPLEINKISNFPSVSEKYLTKIEQKELLKKNGFAVIKKGETDNLTTFYKKILEENIPIYVTSDTPLHLFHILFDETLKDIEEEKFYPDILDVTEKFLEASKADYKKYSGRLKEAAKRNLAYFSVAMKLLDPEFSPPGYVKKWAEWETDKIEKHAGLPDYQMARENSLFRIPEDYSQYKPRGHYTRSEKLKKYFKGMMWYGRMTFLMKGHENFGPISPPAKALTDRETAQIQTLQASLIAINSGKLELKDGRKVSEIWDRIYAVSAFYSGFSDDLTIYDYRKSLREVFGHEFTAEELENEKKYARFLLELSKFTPPAIFSGTGGAGIDPGNVEAHKLVSVEQLDSILTKTMGLRFMGQRYIPDSYILSQLVSPAAGTIPEKIPKRFTVVYIPDERIQPDLYYSIRGFPRGLDVFSVFGSRRAEKHIRDYKDDEYPKYYDQLNKLRNEFSALTEEDWNRNLYWSWLHALKTLTRERGKGYQTYQQTDAWLDRQLNTALASWSALRHNTILYGKQSYTPVHVGITSYTPPPPPPKGILEPLPEFYKNILTTSRMAYSGLKDLEALTPSSERRLSSLVETLEKLYKICKKQVANEPLNDSDNRFLGDFAEKLKNSIGDVEEPGLKTTLIADVHTDLNTKKCLEEASGYLDYIVVAYKRPSEDIILAVGPVLSYYEFKHPMDDRLTDEKWREMLESGKEPERPVWIKSFLSNLR